MNDGLLEVIIERMALYLLNRKVPRPTGVMDRVYTIRTYEIKLESPDHGYQKYVILNPAPRSVSKADGAALTAVYNNDTLLPGVSVCGSKWFLENVFDESV